MRPIDADALIEQINGRNTITKNGQEELEKIIYNEACADLITLIKNAPTVEQSRWIPCSERLPEKGKVVLITNDKGNVRCGQYRGLWSSNGNVTQWTFRGNMIETVVAWMPLPDAYEEDD